MVTNTDNRDALQTLVARYGTSIYKHYKTNIKQKRGTACPKWVTNTVATNPFLKNEILSIK
jgi:hypothetical protein